MIDVSLIDELALASSNIPLRNRADDATEFCAARLSQHFCPNSVFGGSRFCELCQRKAVIRRSGFRIRQTDRIRSIAPKLPYSNSNEDDIDDLRGL